MAIAKQILDENTRTNAQLNELITRLEMYEKDFIACKGHKLFNVFQEKRVKAKELNNFYLEFNRTAWWWYWDIYYMTEVRGIIPNKLDSLKSMVNEYKNNIDSSMVHISPYWDAICRNPSPPIDFNMAFAKQVRHDLDSLREMRNILIEKIVKLYGVK